MIWGSTFVAQSVGMEFIGPFTFQAVRCLIAAIGLLPIISISDRLQKHGGSFLSRWCNKKLWIAGMICSLPLVFANNLQQMGISTTDAGKSAFITAMYIVIVPILGLFRKQKTSLTLWISVGIAVAGMYFLCGAGTTPPALGDLLLFAGAIMFAVQIVCIDIFARSVDCLRLNVIQALICSTLSAIMMCFTENPSWHAIGACWPSLLYAGFLSMGIAYSLQIIGQKYLEATTASLLMCLEAVFASLFGWLLLNEHMSITEMLGAALLLFAVFLSQIPAPKKTMKHKKIS